MCRCTHVRAVRRRDTWAPRLSEARQAGGRMAQARTVLREFLHRLGQNFMHLSVGLPSNEGENVAQVVCMQMRCSLHAHAMHTPYTRHARTRHTPAIYMCTTCVQTPRTHTVKHAIYLHSAVRRLHGSGGRSSCCSSSPPTPPTLQPSSSFSPPPHTSSQCPPPPPLVRASVCLALCTRRFTACIQMRTSCQTLGIAGLRMLELCSHLLRRTRVRSFGVGVAGGAHSH